MARLLRSTAEYKLRAPPLPNLVQTHYRLRNDDGNETTATWRQPVDTPDTIPINTLFRVRIAVGDTGYSDAAALNYSLQWRQNGGAWTATGGENTAAVVQHAGSNNLPGVPVNSTQQITAGTFVVGKCGDIGSTPITITSGSSTEVEFNVKIGHTGGATPGDVFDFRLVANNNPINSYSILASVTTSALIYISPGVKLELAPSPVPSRKPHSRLQLPVVVGSSVTFPPIKTRLTRARLPGPTRSVLRPPTVTATVATGPFGTLKVRLAPSPRSLRQPIWRLRPPEVISAPAGPSQHSQTITVGLARSSRPPRTNSRLAPPTVVSTVAAALAAPIRVKLTRIQPRQPVRFKLQAPTVVGASVVFGPVRVRLAQTPAQARKTSSRLRGPVTFAVVMQALLAPITTRLARVIRIPRTQGQLKPPVVVSPSVVFSPIRIRLAQPPAPVRKTTSRLRAPVSFAVAVQAILAPIRVVLARQTRPPITHSRLRLPVSFAAAIFAPITTRLARVKRVSRTSSVLKPPEAISAPAGPSQHAQTISVSLARTPLRPPGKSRLRSPTVVFAAVVAAVTGYFQNKPAGQTSDRPDETEFQSGPAGRSGSSPDENPFDSPNPRGR